MSDNVVVVRGRVDAPPRTSGPQLITTCSSVMESVILITKVGQRVLDVFHTHTKRFSEVVGGHR